MKVFVTGGTGFIGSQFVIKLLEKRKNVIIYDAFPNMDLLGNYAKYVEIIRGDLLDRDNFEQTARDHKPDMIVHLAAYRNRESQERPMSAYKLNCEGTMNVLEVGRLLKIERIVYASSVAIYGPPNYYRSLGFDSHRLTEKAPPNPNNAYGITKLFNEGMAKQYNDLYCMDTIGLRFAIVYGPGKKSGSQTSLFNDVIEGALEGKSVTIDSFGDQVINLLYVKDAAHALICACFAASPRNLVFNIGGSLCTSRDLINVTSEIIPGACLKIQDTKEERAVASAIDSTLAKEELGYEAQFDLRHAIKDYKEIWWRKIKGSP